MNQKMTVLAKTLIVQIYVDAYSSNLTEDDRSPLLYYRWLKYLLHGAQVGLWN